MAFRVRSGLPPLNQLRDEMDRLLSNFVAHPTVAGATRFVTGREFPAVNVWETAENVFAECELPGVKPEFLDITVVGSELTIKGTRTDDSPQGSTYHRRERGLGSFTRLIRLPVEVLADQVQAALHDGVLLITMPKSETAKPRKVQVQTIG